MIPLNEWQFRLLEKVSKENCTNYHIHEIEGDYYIKADDLIDALDETQDYRAYAEEKLVEVSEECNKRHEENSNSLQLSTIKALDELKEEYEKLKQENETLKSECLRVCNEDALDRLMFEGVEL